MRVVSVADCPDLTGRIPGILAARWPRFLLEGHPGHQIDVAELVLGRVPQYQVVLLDESDRPLGVGLSLPLAWDGSDERLPKGWDGAVSAAAEDVVRRRRATAVCGLSITMTEAGVGRRLSHHLIEALKEIAGQVGAARFIAPVRPIRAAEYPLIPLERYLRWRTPGGEAFDPWVRLHLRLGGTMAGITSESMTITGTVAEWQDWTAMELPGNGDYVVPGGLVPLRVDHDADRGVYQEPNVWIVHHARRPPRSAGFNHL